MQSAKTVTAALVLCACIFSLPTQSFADKECRIMYYYRTGTWPNLSKTAVITYINKEEKKNMYKFGIVSVHNIGAKVSRNTRVRFFFGGGPKDITLRENQESPVWPFVFPYHAALYAAECLG